MTSKRVEHAQALAVEVEAARRAWKESAEAYKLRTDARFQEVVKALRAPGGKNKPSPPSLKTIAKMRKAVHALRTKPGKGRTKDLRAVERLLEEMLEVLPSPP